jgi:C4-dicarboxylate transporter DctQ subunit
VNWLHRLEEAVLALLLASMTLLTFAQVIARYVFNYSFTWALELVTVLFAWLIFLGMTYGVRVGAHIGVDVLVKALGKGPGRWVAMAAAALCAAYGAILAFGSWEYLAKMYMIGIEMEDLPIPQWVVRTVLPFGFGLLCLRFLIILADLARGKSTRLLGDEAEDALKHAKQP